MVNLAKELANDFTEITPLEFYRTIFRSGFLDKKDAFTKGKFVGIGLKGTSNKSKGKTFRSVIVTDELDGIKQLLQSDKFCMIAPLGYVGKDSTTENARVMFAFALEIDNLKNDTENNQHGYHSLISQMNITNYHIIPKCNYIVASGNGLHLYYVLEEPLILHDSTKSRLKELKKQLTAKMWNKFITESYEHPQQESAFQKFRIAGGLTKDGIKTGTNERTRVFKTDRDELWTIEALEEYVSMPKRLTLAQAKKKYPAWAKQLENGIKKNSNTPYYCPQGLYYAMKRKLVESAVVGRRYHCMWGIVVYAKKCNIDFEELERDCKEIRKIFDGMSNSQEDAFTIKDMRDALKAYNDPRTLKVTAKAVRDRTGIESTPVKRNGRTMWEHLQADYWINEKGRKIKNTCKQNRESVLEEMRLNGEITGRPKGSGSKKEIIQRWRIENPIGRKVDCHRETGISRSTIDKWWNDSEQITKALNAPITPETEKDIDAQFEAWLEMYEQQLKEEGNESVLKALNETANKARER